MAQETNYYLLLGLFNFNDDLVGAADDDPSVKSRIEQATKDRNREWSKDSRNPRLASEANYKLDLAKHAWDNLNSQEKRRQAYDDAKATLEKEVRRFVRLFAVKGYMLPGEITKIWLFGCLCGCGLPVWPSGYWRPGSWRLSPPHLSMTRLMRLSRLR